MPAEIRAASFGLPEDVQMPVCLAAAGRAGAGVAARWVGHAAAAATVTMAAARQARSAGCARLRLLCIARELRIAHLSCG
jgi:hypothetical protein